MPTQDPDAQRDGPADRAGTAFLIEGESATWITETDPPTLVRLPLPAAAVDRQRLLLTGADPDGRAVFAHCVEADGAEADGADLKIPGLRTEIRAARVALDDTSNALLLRGLALNAWHRRYRYCPECGAATSPQRDGTVRGCPQCGVELFPRMDPAVMLFLTDEHDCLLLVRRHRAPAGVFSCPAGFVDAGESLERAVRREAHEEAGLDVTDVRYCGSQPWPFPRTLMSAFSAKAAGGCGSRTPLTPADGGEIAEARWWSRAALVEDVRSGALILPLPDSLARRLIESWLAADAAIPPLPGPHRTGLPPGADVPLT